MLQFFARFLLVVFMCMAFAPAQLREEWRKLPELVRHYQLHQATDPALGFFGFLALHYGSEFEQHANSHDHSDLPGKDLPQHHPGFVYLVADLCQDGLTIALHPPVDELVAHWYPELSRLPSAHLSSIWQPPRSC
jgi:hypothetical protein